MHYMWVCLGTAVCLHAVFKAERFNFKSCHCYTSFQITRAAIRRNAILSEFMKSTVNPVCCSCGIDDLYNDLTHFRIRRSVKVTSGIKGLYITICCNIHVLITFLGLT